MLMSLVPIIFRDRHRTEEMESGSDTAGNREGWRLPARRYNCCIDEPRRIIVLFLCFKKKCCSVLLVSGVFFGGGLGCCRFIL